MAHVPRDQRYHDKLYTQPVRWVAVTPSDTVDLPELPKALFIGGAGNVAVNGSDDLAATFSGLTAGSVLPIRPKRVLATGTTATLILALYGPVVQTIS